MIDINKMVQETNQNHEINMAQIAKMRAETQKIYKETKFYPLLALTSAIAATVGAVTAAIINKLF